MKQRLRHVEHLANEHRAEYKRFDESLHLFRTHVDELQPRMEERLRDVTIDTIRTMDVSSFVHERECHRMPTIVSTPSILCTPVDVHERGEIERVHHATLIQHYLRVRVCLGTGASFSSFRY